MPARSTGRRRERAREKERGRSSAGCTSRCKASRRLGERATWRCRLAPRKIALYPDGKRGNVRFRMRKGGEGGRNNGVNGMHARRCGAGVSCGASRRDASRRRGRTDGWTGTDGGGSGGGGGSGAVVAAAVLREITLHARYDHETVTPVASLTFSLLSPSSL